VSEESAGAAYVEFDQTQYAYYHRLGSRCCAFATLPVHIDPYTAVLTCSWIGSEDTDTAWAVCMAIFAVVV